MRGSATGRLVKAFAVTAGLAMSVMPGRAAWADNITDAFIGAYNTSGLLEQNRALLRAADEDVVTPGSLVYPRDPIRTPSFARSRDQSPVVSHATSTRAPKPAENVVCVRVL